MIRMHDYKYLYIFNLRIIYCFNLLMIIPTLQKNTILIILTSIDITTEGNRKINMAPKSKSKRTSNTSNSIKNHVR